MLNISEFKHRKEETDLKIEIMKEFHQLIQSLNQDFQKLKNIFN